MHMQWDNRWLLNNISRVMQEAKWGYRRTMGAMFAYSKQADRMLMSYNCQVQQYARAGQARVTTRMSLIQCIR
jgi:hypothetical protein